MDLFKKTQYKEIGPGGFRCSCCKGKARRKHGRVDKGFNKTARTRLKRMDLKEKKSINYKEL